MLDEENDGLPGSACHVIMSYLILNEKREAKIMRQQKRQVTDKATICAMLDEMDTINLGTSRFRMSCRSISAMNGMTS